MKKIATLALASMISTAAIAVPLDLADAHSGWAGFGLGFIAGALVAPYLHRYYYHPYYYHPYHPYYYRTYYHPYNYYPYHHYHHRHHYYSQY